MRQLASDGVCLGVDEAGRGAIAGPLVVACVALPDEPRIIGIDDSKKLTAKRREQLAAEIREHALGIGIASIEPGEIDACGMAASLRVAMTRAIAECESDLSKRDVEERISAVLIDGNPMRVHEKERCVVKGDGKVACIAAASIVAKVHRDGLMRACSSDHPAYAFDSNKGYGSAAHIRALRDVGPSPIHRMSFLGNILAEQQTLL